MSQNGYQKFFKEARKNSSVSTEKPRRFTTADELDQLLSQTKTTKKSHPQFAVERSRKVAVRKKSSRSTKVMITLSMMGFLLVLGAMSFDEEIEKSLSKIEISFFGMTQARAENESAVDSKNKKDDPAKKEDEKKDTAKKTTEEPAKEGESGEKAVEKAAQAQGAEHDHLLTLAQRKKELDQRDEDLKQTEAQIQEQKKELDKKIAELEETRRKIASILEERVKVDEQKVETLVQVYSNMRAPQAAKIFETMDEGLVVEILGRMKKKNAADVMNLIKPEKAQIFSEKLAGYRTNK